MHAGIRLRLRRIRCRASTPRYRSVRLNVDLLDRMSGMSDMVLARNELARRLRARGTRVEAALERLSLTVADAATR